MISILAKNRTAIFSVIIAALIILIVFLWKRNQQPLTISVPSETSENELKALQQQLDQLLELQQQLEK